MALIKESPDNRWRHRVPHAALKHFQDFFKERTNGDMSDTVKFEIDPTWEDYATPRWRARVSKHPGMSKEEVLKRIANECEEVPCERIPKCAWIPKTKPKPRLTASQRSLHKVYYPKQLKLI